MVVIICAFVIEGIEIYVDVVNLINYNIVGVLICKSCVHAACTYVYMYKFKCKCMHHHHTA